MQQTDLIQQAKQSSWYHTLEFPGYTTTGIFDLRSEVGQYGIPGDLSGKRVLEVGTWDGFWAFEMERRGADVVAIDLDDERDLDAPPRRRPSADQLPEEPRGKGFHLAKEIYDSKVERVVRSIYHCKPEDLGTFDVVFCGSVLIHLRDQLLALERIADLTKPGGLFISAEEYEPITDLVPFPIARFRGNREAAVVFWVPSRKAWRQMLWHAGFDKIDEFKRFTMKSSQGYSVRHAVHHARKA